MGVIAVATSRQFWANHPDAEKPLKAWYAEVSKAGWTQLVFVKFIGTHEAYDRVDAETIEPA